VAAPDGSTNANGPILHVHLKDAQDAKITHHGEAVYPCQSR